VGAFEIGSDLKDTILQAVRMRERKLSGKG